MRPRAAVALAGLLAVAPARAQTMLEQQQRLIEIHSLLIELPPVEAPGAYRPYEVSLGAEVITIPSIDGTTGGRRQITASDHTPLFPRPRLAVGLPAPEGFRTFVGAAYVPPFTISDVSTHYGAVEAGVAYAPAPLTVGLRVHAVYAFSKSPVTEPQTRDTLESFLYGAEVAAGYRVESGWLAWTPYAGAGVTHLHGRFRVTSDGVVLTGDQAVAALHAGLRLRVKSGLEAVGELDAYPGRLVHPNFRVAYTFDLH